MLTGFCGSVVPTFSEYNMNLSWKTRMPGTCWAILSDRFRHADTVPGYVAGLSFRHRQCAPVRARLSSDRFIYSDNVPRYVPGYIQTQTVYSGMCLDSH